jgi:hypothetical protein
VSDLALTRRGDYQSSGELEVSLDAERFQIPCPPPLCNPADGTEASPVALAELGSPYALWTLPPSSVRKIGAWVPVAFGY